MTQEPSQMPEPKPCPFCGEQPELDTNGTWVSIECCVSMSFQKSDIASREELGKWDDQQHVYENDGLAISRAIDEWNTRAASVPVQSIKEYPDTLPEDQRISQPETTGSSEVDRSERVFINSPSDKDRAEALKVFSGCFDPHNDWIAGCGILIKPYIETIKRALILSDQTETKPTSDEVVNALVEALESVEYHSPMTAGQKESIPKIQQALALAKKVGV